VTPCLCGLSSSKFRRPLFQKRTHPFTAIFRFKATHLRVVKTTGADLTVSDAVIRYVGLVIAFAVVFIGVLWVIWDANKQGWHDKMAGTYVIRV